MLENDSAVADVTGPIKRSWYIIMLPSGSRYFEKR